MADGSGRRERALLVSRAGVVGAGTMVSRLLGLVRDVTIASLFTRLQTDAFWVAFTIPNALRQLLAEGAVSSAVVPILAGKLETEGETSATAMACLHKNGGFIYEFHNYLLAHTFRCEPL